MTSDGIQAPSLSRVGMHSALVQREVREVIDLARRTSQAISRNSVFP
jgi:hypothetical protein